MRRVANGAKITSPQLDLESSYDRVAERYAEEYFAELERKRFDRKLLDAFAASVRRPGEVCEIGSTLLQET